MHTNDYRFENIAPVDEVALLITMVKAVVHYPDQVTVSATHGRDVTVLTISVNQDDVSHVFGREKRTLQSITHLVAKASAMRGRRTIVNLEIQQEIS